MLWVLQEERRGDVQELDKAWRDNGLALLPPALGYLILECGASAGYRAAVGWYHRAIFGDGTSMEDSTSPGFFTPRRTLEVAQAVLAARRRRERVLPTWKRDYQAFTNRTNRVQGRVLKLVREQVRDTLSQA